MPKLLILVGPPGAGKSTLAKDRLQNDGDHGAATVYVNGDFQGRDGHVRVFLDALEAHKDILVDRMNFNAEQRSRYLLPAKTKGYDTEIIVLHQPYDVCLERIRARFGKHETVNDEKSARNALQVFFTKYERPTEDEADKVTFVYPEGPRTVIIVNDLDGSLCNIDHRLSYVRKPEGIKKDWAGFFREIPNDAVNYWNLDILNRFAGDYKIVFCSGRDDNQRKNTVDWLDKYCKFSYELYMRPRNDMRRDDLIKEVILDFELLTRYSIYFWIDDRQQVVDKIRSRGITVLQCAKGNF